MYSSNHQTFDSNQHHVRVLCVYSAECHDVYIISFLPWSANEYLLITATSYYAARSLVSYPPSHLLKYVHHYTSDVCRDLLLNGMQAPSCDKRFSAFTHFSISLSPPDGKLHGGICWDDSLDASLFNREIAFLSNQFFSHICFCCETSLSHSVVMSLPPSWGNEVSLEQ